MLHASGCTHKPGSACQSKVPLLREDVRELGLDQYKELDPRGESHCWERLLGEIADLSFVTTCYLCVAALGVCRLRDRSWALVGKSRVIFL